MRWVPVAVNPAEVTSEYLYDLAKAHRLVPENIIDAVGYFNELSSSCRVVLVKDVDTEDKIGYVIFSEIVDNESAMVDFIPMPKHFSASNPGFRDEIREALMPIFEGLINGRGLRRITAMVPVSRNRTKKALIACGFKKEGRMRDMVKFKGKDAEDIIVLGMLSNEE